MRLMSNGDGINGMFTLQKCALRSTYMLCVSDLVFDCMSFFFYPGFYIFICLIVF